MSLVRFALYSLVGILFVTNVSQWGLVIAVVIINFISDMAGTYAGGLSAPLIVDLVGEDEFAPLRSAITKTTDNKPEAFLI